MKPEFPLNNAVLMMALAAAYPLSAAAAVSAGVAQFAVGEVNLRRADGRTDALVKGRDIESGQAIVTGPDGRAQLKFSDGGVVSLQPNTEFKITHYVDQADAKLDRFLVDFLRGSMRTITGLIGKRNRENYKVTTATATIGIRGSGFNAAYNPDGTLSVTTEFDAIEVCTAAGCIGLTAGESVLVIRSDAPPVRTNTRANVPTPQTVQAVVVAGNQIDASGSSSTVKTSAASSATTTPPTTTPPITVPPKTLLAGVAFTSHGLTASGFAQQSGNSTGALLIGDGTNAAQPVSYTSAVGTASLVGSGTVIASSGSLATGDYLVLGTWSGSSWVTPSGSTVTVGPTAFVAGVPSPLTALASLSGLRASYSLKNATPVFSSVTGPGALLASSKLSVDFSGAGSYVDVNLDVSMPSEIYNLRGGITMATNDTGFTGKLAVSSPSCISAATYCGPGTVDGGFVGPTAGYAGLSFGAYSQAHGNFGGAATFAQTAQAPTPSNSSLTDLRASVTDGSAIITNYEYASNIPTTTVTPTFVGAKLVKLVDNTLFSGVLTLQNTSPSPSSYGALGTISETDFLGWGNWATGSKNFAPMYGSPTSSMLDSVHYVVGRPTPNAQMPTSGIANYAMVGGTAPTATLSGVTQTGQLVGATLSANFGVGSAIAIIATQFGATPVTINQSVSFTPGTANFSGLASGTAVSGFFTGNQAFRAGLVYSTNNAAIGQVTGAAAFQRSN